MIHVVGGLQLTQYGVEVTEIPADWKYVGGLYVAPVVRNHSHPDVGTEQCHWVGYGHTVISGESEGQ